MPIRINFLGAADGTPLTKTYTKRDDGSVETQPYPFVRDFNSYHYEIETLEDMLVAMKQHSALGHCFLKGNLDTKLNNESRAGHTNATTPTQLIQLDLDFNEGFRDIEHFLQVLDPMFHDVSYILQHSNSAGITGPVGLRAHIEFLTYSELPVALLKLWSMKKNLDVPELRKLITLSANGMSLRYPLDITTCQNDKIIYIARPTCTNFDDPLEDTRIVLVKKQFDRITGNLAQINPQQVQEQVDALVAELRKAAGLKPKVHKYAAGGTQLLLNPDRALVTTVKTARNWTYLNLNGGDSLAYYHSTEKPDLLYNFKGEPSVRLRDIAPDYAAQLHQAERGKQELVPHVFRDRTRDVYYNCLYNPNTKDIDSLDQVSSKPKMKDFLAQYDVVLPDPIEDWRVEFDPRTTEVYQERNKWINSFRPTIYLKTDYAPVPRIPTIIDKVLTSICVDKEYKAFFINWLAFVYQYREKTVVCPIFHGIQGTGKGLLQEEVLKPLLGFEHTPKLTTQQFKDQFNGWMERAIVAVWDEAQQDDAFDSTVYDKAKFIISEHHTTLRLMRTNPMEVRNYVNLMVFTNHPYPFPLDRNDRRFSPAPAQMNKLEITQGEVDMIADELEMFASYLQHFQVNSAAARTVLYNQARRDMINGSANTVDAFFYALREGKLDYFLSFVRDRAVAGPENTYVEFERTLKRWCSAALEADGGTTLVSRDETMLVYSYIIKRFDSPAKFKKMGDKYHMAEERGFVNSKRARGWGITWQIEDEAAVHEFISPKVSKLHAI